MPSALWKITTITLLLALVLSQFTSRWGWTSFKDRNREMPLHEDDHRDPNVTWTFVPSRDRYNHGLASWQCDLAFPDLYVEIDRAIEQWKHRRITTEAIDVDPGNDGSVRVLIHDSQLQIIRTVGMERNDFRHRIISVLNQLLRALTAVEATGDPAELLPDVEFTIVVDDIPVLNGRHDRAPWSFTRAFGDQYQDNVWLIPDFHFFAPDFPGGGGFREMQRKSMQHDSPLAKKKLKALWRGVIWTNEKLRGALLKAGHDQAGQKQPWADIEEMQWDKPGSVMPMDDFCRYAFLVNTEGRSWSARMVHLLNCDSVPFLHDAQWITHYYHLLKDGRNCVRVDRDFSNLAEKVQYYSQNLEAAQQIADGSIHTFRDRYTSPAATSCYWRRLLRAWSSVAFVPEVYEPLLNFPDRFKIRGQSFEEFIVHLNSENYPYGG